MSIDKSIKIGKSDLIDIDFSDQSVEIDDTLVSFIDLSLILPISSIHIGRNISSSVHQKIKTEFIQTVNLLTIEWQLRVEGSNSYHRDYIVYQTVSLIKKILSFLQNQVLNLLLMADIGQVCRRPALQDLDLPPFQNIVGVDPSAVTSRRAQSSQ